MRKFLRGGAFPRAGGSGRGPQPPPPPDLPRGRGAAAVLAGLALVAGGCGSGHQLAKTPPPKRAATPTPPPVPQRKPAAAADVAVIRGWADALRHGKLERAVGYFAIPSVVSNGTSPIRLTSRSDVRFFNRTLPCGAKVVKAVDTGAFVVATFELTERPGPGVCGSGVGGRASTAFLIRHHRIVQWRRVLDPAAAEPPAGSQS
ncbi:MAG: hypothetical protein QOD73_3260 [Solirubrobacteraceae bacterium]|nr:hypothetical protein [Solirubrobacteraceae bacterium]